jgi:hypothetical protein
MKINANDQLDVIGACLSGCDSATVTYEYKIYMLNAKQWIPFTNISYFIYTGLAPYTSLTVKEDLFFDNFPQKIWKIDFGTLNTNSSSAIVFYVNFPPRFGTCDISPTNGTTNTLFSIMCLNWMDLDGSLNSFSYYGIVLQKSCLN